MMIKIYDDNKHICECCDNDSAILLQFLDDIALSKNLATTIVLCEDCKEKLIDILKLF